MNRISFLLQKHSNSYCPCFCDLRDLENFSIDRDSDRRFTLPKFCLLDFPRFSTNKFSSIFLWYENLDLILYNEKSKCGFHDFHRLRRHYFTWLSLWKPSEWNYLKKWIRITKAIFWAIKKHLQSHNRKSVGGTLEKMCDRGNFGKTFRFESELRMHLRLHDNTVTKCSFCPWKTSNQTYLQQHFDHHFKTPKFKCSKCDRSFYIKNNLDHHFETTHEIIKDKYKCKICDYKTNSRSYFCHHLRRNHKI